MSDIGASKKDGYELLSTQSIGKVWIYRLLFLRVCLFVCVFVCMVTNFSGEFIGP